MQLGPDPIAPGSAGADPRYNSPASEEQTTLEPKTQASRPSLDYAAGAIFGVITLDPNDFAEKEGRQTPKPLRNADYRAFLARRRGREYVFSETTPWSFPTTAPKSQPKNGPGGGP